MIIVIVFSMINYHCFSIRWQKPMSEKNAKKLFVKERENDQKIDERWIKKEEKEN